MKRYYTRLKLENGNTLTWIFSSEQEARDAVASAMSTMLVARPAGQSSYADRFEVQIEETEQGQCGY